MKSNENLDNPNTEILKYLIEYGRPFDCGS